MVIEYRIREKNKLYNKVYQLWYNMLQRCTNPKNPYYKNYGGKGVKISDEWLDLNVFIEEIDKVVGFNIDDFENGKLTLDKDILHSNIYSLKTCRFISKEDNNKIKPNQQIKFIAISSTGEHFFGFNQSEFAKENNLRQSKISECLNGIRKTHNGWRFIPLERSCND